MCIAILTDPLFIPTHRYLMNHANEYYVKGVYLVLFAAAFSFHYRCYHTSSARFLLCHDGYIDNSTRMRQILHRQL